MSINVAELKGLGNVAQPLRQPSPAELTVSLAFSPEDVRASQRLRYSVFAQELGAQLRTLEPGIDSDGFDAYCQHIIVRDQVTREVVASTRVLLDVEARLAGGFYSAGEFELADFLQGAGRVMEIGRTCVHPGYRSGAAIGLLWSGLARFIDVRSYEYLVGCASVPMGDNGTDALAIYDLLKDKYLLPPGKRVVPRLPLPERAAPAGLNAPALPPLLKAYLRLGARIGGEPCWDPLFNCADIFVVLSPVELQRRYARHFLQA